MFQFINAKSQAMTQSLKLYYRPQKRIIQETEKAEEGVVIELGIGINKNHEMDIYLMQDMKDRNSRCKKDHLLIW